MQENTLCVINCINSCTNLDQLKICETIISLFKFRLMKDGATEQEVYIIESDLLETYLNKESILFI